MSQTTVNKKMEKSFGKVYSATYSGVDVYELIDTTGSIMRRKQDGWVNATHILKAANFPKAKRTRILEKDVQTGVHEKIQGGYGKYQGTWVPLETAKDLAQEFGVHDRLVPLFETVSSNGASSPPPAPKHHHASKTLSVNEKSTATKAKKTASMPNLSNNNSNKQQLPPPELGSFGETLKKRGRPKRAEGAKEKKRVLKASKVSSNNKERLLLDVDTDDDQTQIEPNGDEQDEDQSTDRDLTKQNATEDEIEDVDGSSDTEIGEEQLLDTFDLEGSQRGKILDRLRENFDHDHDHGLEDDTVALNGGHKGVWYDSNAEYIQRLLDYFMSGEVDSESGLPSFLLKPPKSLHIDQVLDDEGNTIFHWTCAMGAALAADAFIKLGANYRSVNKEGETSLMRTVHFVNAYDKRTFPALLELLSENIFEFDSNQRTILHHIAMAGDSEARMSSSYYYMDLLLAKIKDSQSAERLSNYVNLQDVNGNTALHICADNANKKCIKLLVNYNASISLTNNSGLVASEILLGSENATPTVHKRYKQHLRLSKIQEQRKLEQQQQQQQQQQREEEEEESTDIVSLQTKHQHYSETAMNIAQKESDLLLQNLLRLSESFDKALIEKDSEIKEVQTTVSSIIEDLQGESITSTGKSNEDLILLEKEMNQLETSLQERETVLTNLLEYSQRNVLKELVETNEKLINTTDTDTEPDSIDSRTKIQSEIQDLQTLRKQSITSLFKLLAKYYETSSQMQKYVKLISFSADMKIDQVIENIDGLLNELQNEETTES